MNSAKASAATEGSILPQATMPAEPAEDLPVMEGPNPTSLSSHPASEGVLEIIQQLIDVGFTLA